ncbi:hypothetical protein FOZ63_031791 [Perkinsus olseni]|uniref:Peptidase A1 domain-containing protein n=1 Tax=Perkinsus olseni TaxID=32597 RepID=A0A7J6QAG0_PEROL|nr:hypothetical protein FOZ63_031791 [Perkinsus olseni]
MISTPSSGSSRKPLPTISSFCDYVFAEIVGSFFHDMLTTRLPLAALSVILPQSVTASKELRLPVYFREVHDMGNRDYCMVTPVKADKQSLNLQIDTGSDSLFVVEKEFLERTLSPATCEDFTFGCYDCHTHLCKTEVEETRHMDGTCAYTVQHRGALELGGQTIPDVDFGLVVGYTPNDSTPHASLGLAPRDDGGPTPLIDQLIDKGVINRPDFSIYFKPDNPNEGELILGGEDPSRYKKPMLIVPLTEEADGWEATMEGLDVDGESIPVRMPILIDSGSSILWIPYEALSALLKVLALSASKAAGRWVRLEVQDKELVLSNCSDRVYLPPLELRFRGRGDQRPMIVIPPEIYVEDPRLGGMCTLPFRFFRGDSLSTAVLGLNLLRKYYLHFQYVERQIRFAEVAESEDLAEFARTSRREQRKRRKSFDDSQAKKRQTLTS